MKKYLCMVLALIMLLVSCAVENKNSGDEAPAAQVFHTTEPEKADRQRLDEIDAAMQEAIRSSDPTPIMDYLSPDFSVTKAQLRNFLESQSEECEKIGEYYATGLPTDGSESIEIKQKDDDEIFLGMIPQSEQAFVALYRIGEDKLSRVISMLAVKDEEFKVLWIDIGDYKYFGKDARSYYDMAKESSDKNALCAYLYAEMMYNLVSPGKFMKYKDFADMESLYTETREKIKPPLEIEGQSVYAIGLENNADLGVIPTVNFKTEIPIENQEELRAAGEKIIKKLEADYPGFTETFKNVNVSATDDEASQTAKRWSFVYSTNG